MGLSDRLAELNFNRYQNFVEQPERPAMFAFNGDVYNNIKRDCLRLKKFTEMGTS